MVLTDHTKNRYLLILLALVLFSIVMNTSRFGLGAILLTDFILLRVSYPRYRYVFNIVMALLAGLAYLYLFGKFDTDEIDFQNASTLLFRLAIWASLLIVIGKFSLTDLLFGIDPVQLKKAVTYSLESQLFYLIFNWGVLGVIFVTILIYSLVQLYGRLHHLHRVMLLLVGVNSVFVSVLANQIFEYSTITIVMLILSYLIWCSGQYQEKVRSVIA